MNSVFGADSHYVTIFMRGEVSQVCNPLNILAGLAAACALAAALSTITLQHCTQTA